MRVGSLDAARDALVQTCRRLAAAGLSPGSSGNVSVRIGDLLLMTPTGSSLARMSAIDIAVVSLETGAADPGPMPSKELPMHLAAYARRPDVRAVVHLHSPHATAVSCLPGIDGRAALPPFTPYRVMRLGDVPLAPYARPGSAALASNVGDVIATHDVVLLANHGSIVVANDLDTAADLADELETAAMISLLLAGRAANVLPAEEVAALDAARSHPAPSSPAAIHDGDAPATFRATTS